ncbi:unnamed protein product [marine sediment metagenome]|uniref:Uncharacterized protein n=1 Tax=marine sediment metagenome TaxID=412755 RepID=X0X2J0_9ZZZZ
MRSKNPIMEFKFKRNKTGIFLEPVPNNLINNNLKKKIRRIKK